MVFSLQLHDQIDQLGCAQIDQTDNDDHEHHEQKNDSRVVQQLFLGRPGDLLELVPHVLERIADLLEEIHKTGCKLLEEVGLGVLFDLLFSHGLHILPKSGKGGAVCTARRLLGLAVSRVLLAETAVLVQLDTIGGVLLVLHGIVVTLLALGAGQHHFVTGNACHVRHLLLKCGQTLPPAHDDRRQV
jgi:hypothetical protein